MKFGLKEIVLSAGILFGVVKAGAQDYGILKENAWRYNPVISMEVDLNGDGVKDKFVAADSAGLNGYDYKLFAEFRDESGNVVERKKLSETSEMVYGLRARDGKLICRVNRGVNYKGFKEGTLYEEREIPYDGEGNFGKAVIGDLSKDDPTFGEASLK